MSPAKGFTTEERAAMKARALELKAEERANRDAAAGEADVLAAIGDMPEPERALARRIHDLVRANAPQWTPKTWYGMPAWARDGKVVCFFQSSKKFGTRYATFGFTDQAKLDDGDLWATGFAVRALSDVVEARVVALVRAAVG